MTKIINVIATHDLTIFPNELLTLKVELSEDIPENCLANISPIEQCPSRLRISNPTVFYRKFDLVIANFDDGQYWDGIIGNIHGDVFDIDDEILPNGFFGKDEKYSIPYNIKNGDVIAIAEVIENGKQKRGGKN